MPTARALTTRKSFLGSSLFVKGGGKSPVHCGDREVVRHSFINVRSRRVQSMRNSPARAPVVARSDCIGVGALRSPPERVKCLFRKATERNSHHADSTKVD